MTIIWYGSWDINCNRQIFFVIFGHVLPLYLLKTRKIKISQNWKKAPGDIIILHKCTKNHDHRLYCSWAIVCAGCNCYFSFWTNFYPSPPPPSLPPPDSPENGEKKHLEISSFYTSVPKIMIIGYTVPEIWHMADVIVIFHFGLYFVLFLP